jgi:hypothetical protein
MTTSKMQADVNAALAALKGQMSDDLNSSLDYLWEMLTDQGLYMEANIVALAQNRIDELEPNPGSASVLWRQWVLSNCVTKKHLNICAHQMETSHD